MTICRAQCHFPAAGGFSEDDVVNVWHFDITDAHTEGNVTPVRDALAGFYNRIIASLNNSIAWSLGRLKVYDLGEPPPRAPIYDQSLSVTGTSGATRLPSELCVCLTYQAEQLSGVSQRRRRGRIYLGPLNQADLEAGSAHVATAVTQSIASSATVLLQASATAPNWAWIVHSGTSAGNSPVHDGWVDNAFDIQRRRGVDPTIRTTWA